jgi:hypothetical protein
VIGGVADRGERNLGDIDPEEVEAVFWVLAAVGRECGDEVGEDHGIGDLDRPARDLGVAIGHLDVERRAVEREARVAQQVPRLERSVHHPDPQVAPVERHLDPADARRSVLAQRRQHLVLVGVEARPHPGREMRVGRGDVVPGSHREIFAPGRDRVSSCGARRQAARRVARPPVDAGGACVGVGPDSTRRCRNESRVTVARSGATARSAIHHAGRSTPAIAAIRRISTPAS